LLQGGFPFVSANLHIEHALLQARIRPAYIANIAGWRIGISGVTTLSTGDLVPSRILQGITFTDPQEAIGRVVEALEPLVDTIVILSHFGFYEDGRGDYGLAVHLTGSKVSLILGGHTHRALDPARTIGGIVICNAGPFGANVNEVKLRWGQHGVIEVSARLLPQDETIADDDSLVAACSDMAQTFRALHETTLALPTLPRIDATGEATYVRDRERVLLAKSLSAAGKVDPAAILFLPLLYVPGQLPGGEYATLADIATTYANSEYLVEAEINGDKLKELLSLQSSLLYYQQAQPIWLIDETPVLPQQVQDDSTYKVIVTELILEGGLGWNMVRYAMQHSRLLDITCEQVVLAYLQS
jgi:2',3'-cyclic-nucleotide 2'-phosphodiesterase (5'-nucleotidase family)